MEYLGTITEKYVAMILSQGSQYLVVGLTLGSLWKISEM